MAGSFGPVWKKCHTALSGDHITAIPFVVHWAEFRRPGVTWSTKAQRAVRSGDWKLRFDGPRTMLFNVRTDPGERANLIVQRSDIARGLAPLLAAWQKDVDDESRRATPR